MFNGVGVLGAAVQLATLAALVHVAHLDYLAATAIAVEAAVLHNFAWHWHWTWRDRASGASLADLWASFGRFHVANGLVSIVGNVALMALLVGALHVPPVVANALAILVCSLVNFALGDRWVFGPQRSAGDASSPSDRLGQRLRAGPVWGARHTEPEMPPEGPKSSQVTDLGCHRQSP
jgi:putative flippase GtrA